MLVLKTQLFLFTQKYGTFKCSYLSQWKVELVALNICIWLVL
jgi:hypothetical protein